MEWQEIDRMKVSRFNLTPRSPALQADSLPSEPPGKPKEVPYDPIIPLLGIYLMNLKKTLIWKDMYPYVHHSIIKINNRQDMETT